MPQHGLTHKADDQRAIRKEQHDLNSILIGSEDPQKLVDYYTKLFGEPSWNEGGTRLDAGSGSVTVGPHDQVKGKNVSPAGSSGTSRALT